MQTDSIVAQYKDTAGQFDYVTAWYEWVMPRLVALPEDVLCLLRDVALVSGKIRQDGYLDLPWPTADDSAEHAACAVGLQEAFSKIEPETLKSAAAVIHAFGHWMPAGLVDAERLLKAVKSSFDGWAIGPTGAYRVLPDDLAKLVRFPDRFPGATWKFSIYADQSVRERAGVPWKGRTKRAATPLEALCTKHRVSLDLERGTVEATDTMHKSMTGWKATLRLGDKCLRVPFYTGSAIAKPTAADVLSCLLREASGFDNAGGSFSFWCSCEGLDEDSISAARTYRACARVAPRLRVLLGQLYAEFSAAEH